MVTEPKKTGRPRMSDAERQKSVDRRREKNVQLGRERTAAANSIGKIPKCKNPRRRREAEKSLRAWIETYLITLFATKQGVHYPFSRTQYEAMDVAERVIREGGNFGIAMRRGGFKTGLCKAALIFGMATGLQGWICLIAATEDKAKRILESVKTVLEISPLLAEDYPEMCYPIRKLESQANRTLRQTYIGPRGKELQTRMQWETDRVVLADIVRSKSRQCIITAIGLTGSDIRGQLKTTGDMLDRRPTCLLFDDVETDTSAASDVGVPKRMKLFSAAMEMGGIGNPIAAFYAGTIIEGDSVCSRVLAAPKWNAMIRPAMPSMPLHCSETPPEIEHEDLWGEYGELIRLSDPAEARKQSSDLYARHRAKAECLPILDQPRPCETCELHDKCMDAGAVVDWIHAKNPEHQSAVEFCMEKYLLDPAVFFSEYQQAPRTSIESVSRVTPAQIMRRVNGYDRGVVPADAVVLACGIDMGLSYLYYTLTAFAADFTGYVVGYGAWPDQGRRIFYKGNPPHPMRLDYPNLDDDGMMRAALIKLLKYLKGLEFSVAGHQRPKQIDKVLVDGRFGTKNVFNAIREVEWGTVAQVFKGVALSPRQKPIYRWEKDRPGYKIGENGDWYSPPIAGTADAPHVSADTNVWKTRLHKSLALPPLTRGGFTLWGAERTGGQHEMWANSVGNSELSTELPKDPTWGNVVVQWKPIPGGSDNEGFDTAVYAMVAARMTGLCRFPVEGEKPILITNHRLRTAAEIAGRT